MSPIAEEEQVQTALSLLEERFAASDLDGPTHYSNFVADVGDEEEALRRRQEAVATVRAFLRSFNAGTEARQGKAMNP